MRKASWIFLKLANYRRIGNLRRISFLDLVGRHYRSILVIIMKRGKSPKTGKRGDYSSKLQSSQKKLEDFLHTYSFLPLHIGIPQKENPNTNHTINFLQLHRTPP